MFVISFALFLVLSASVLSPALSSGHPLHAECKLQWTWANTNCSVVHKALLDQVGKWTGPENCKQGGEKCLYEIVSDNEHELKLKHTTPVSKYIDSVTFSFCDSVNGECVNSRAVHSNTPLDRPKRSVHLTKKLRYLPASGGGCAVDGFSTSKVWYAVLDYGTNYCNMRNLAEGAGLADLADFKEVTGDNMCTMYSERNCTKY